VDQLRRLATRSDRALLGAFALLEIEVPVLDDVPLESKFADMPAVVGLDFLLAFASDVVDKFPFDELASAAEPELLAAGLKVVLTHRFTK
jgi:hypothetical protein